MQRSRGPGLRGALCAFLGDRAAGRGALFPSGRRGRIRRGLGREAARLQARVLAARGPAPPLRVRGRGPGRRAGSGVRAAGAWSRRGGPRPASAAAARPLGLPATRAAPGPGRRLCCPQPAEERPRLGAAWGGGAGPARLHRPPLGSLGPPGPGARGRRAALGRAPAASAASPSQSEVAAAGPAACSRREVLRG